MASRPRSSQFGFTLLEAMVSITILATALFATFSWVNVSLQTFVRADRILVGEIATNELLEQLQLTDFSSTKSGDLLYDDLLLVWEARLLESKSGKNNRGMTGYFDHDLYEISIQGIRDSRLTFVHMTHFVVSRRVREPRLEL